MYVQIDHTCTYIHTTYGRYSVPSNIIATCTSIRGDLGLDSTATAVIIGMMVASPSTRVSRRNSFVESLPVLRKDACIYPHDIGYVHHLILA